MGKYNNHFKQAELRHELRNEPSSNSLNNWSIEIDGKVWKTVASRFTATKIVNTLQAKGKKARAIQTDRPVSESKKEKSAVDKIRKPTAPPTKAHADKNKYNRKEKHKKDIGVDESTLAEKSVSKSQQRAAGAALAAKKSGDTSKLKGASKEMAKMSKNDLEDFAKTKHKGLPEKKQTKESKTMKFKDMVKLVIESGGQQQIDPVDEALFAWAKRVAAAKVEESKQEIYAGLLYERNGGTFNLYDVLSEDK